MEIKMSNFQEKIKYIGNLAQLFELKEYRMTGGRADGMRAVDVDNGSGLCFTVLTDRSMDFGRVTFQGKNISFLSPCGYVAPQYYDNRRLEWLKSFTAGLLTTCGLDNIGMCCTDDGEELGVHGRISNMPAEQVSCRLEREADGTPAAVISGVVRHSRIYKENLLLTREIRCRYGENTIYMHDKIENIGVREAPLMRLYHFNLGYPLIDEDAEVLISSAGVTPKSEFARQYAEKWNQLQKPEVGCEEMCYYHDMLSDEKGYAIAGAYQPKSSMGAVIRYDTASLDHFVEWKMMAEGDYVLGLEPANAHIDGRDQARADGTLKMIRPGETVESSFCIQMLSGEQDLLMIKEEIRAMQSRRKK